MFLTFLLSAQVQVEPTAPPADPVPWVVVERPEPEQYDTLVNPQLVAFADGTLVAAYQHLGHYGSLLGQRIVRSEDHGRTWRSVAVLEHASDTSLFERDGVLWLLGRDERGTADGAVTIRRSIDRGTTWTEPASETQGLLRGRGLHASISAPACSHDGRIWRAFTHQMITGGSTHFCAVVGSAESGADLLQASNWRWSTELPLSFQPISYCTLASLDEKQPLALLVSDPSEVSPASAVVSADGWTLSPKRAEEQLSMPMHANGGRVVRDAKTNVGYALVSQEIAVPHKWEHWWPKNVLALRATSDLAEWYSGSDVLHDPAGERYSLPWTDAVIEGDDMLVLVVVICIGDKEAKRPWDRKLVFLRVPKFRERSAATPPLWGPVVPR